MKMRYQLQHDGWRVTDPITGNLLIELKLPASATMRHELALYGLKQVVADAGALDRGASRTKRIIEMQKRYNAILQGHWSNRGGASTVRLPDSDVFNALVALGIVKPDEQAVRVWSAASAAARRRYAERADVAEWLRRNVAADAAADAALAAFMGQSADDEPADDDEPAGDESDEPAADVEPADDDEPATDEPAADDESADDESDEPAADEPAGDEPAGDDESA